MRFAQLLVSPVLPTIRTSFGVSAGVAGLALSAMWWAYACSQIPSGRLADRVGGRPVVLVALAVTGAAALVLALAPSALPFGVALAALGVGAGLYYNAATALLTARFDAVGRAIGLHRIGGQTAGVVAPTVAAFLAVRVGWRGVLAAGSLVAVPAFVLVVRGVRPVDADRPDGSASLPAALALLRSRPGLLFTTALAALGEFVLVATTSFLPTVLYELHGFSLSTAGLLFAGYFAVVAAFQPVAGWLSDRAGRDAAAGAAFLSGAVGYATLATATSDSLAVASLPLVGVAMCWGPPLQSRAFDALPPFARGTGFGVVRAGYLVVGASGSAVVGALADAAGWRAAVLALAAVLGLGALAVGVANVVGAGR